jgi:hypothetical protein
LAEGLPRVDGVDDLPAVIVETEGNHPHHIHPQTQLEISSVLESTAEVTGPCPHPVVVQNCLSNVAPDLLELRHIQQDHPIFLWDAVQVSQDPV